MELEKPKHYYTMEGNIIQSIGIERIHIKEKIQKRLSLTKEEIEGILDKLLQEGDIYLNQKGMYYVEPTLWKQWKDFTREYNNAINNPFIKYAETNNIINKHVFLDSEKLYKAICNLIQNAKKKIVIVNPFIQLLDPIRRCGLLRNEKNIDIKIITRKPEEYKTYTRECLQFLEKRGVSVHYSISVHGKVLVVDDIIAVVSSLNFLENSAFGKNWEAGIITYDKSVINQITESIENIAIDESIDPSMNEETSTHVLAHTGNADIR